MNHLHASCPSNSRPACARTQALGIFAVAVPFGVGFGLALGQSTPSRAQWPIVAVAGLLALVSGLSAAWSL